MSNYGKPCLCGGTFFTLILQALKQRARAREHYKGERDGLSDPEVLVGLIKVINPDYQEPKGGLHKGKANDYKQCRISRGDYLPFDDIQTVNAFDSRVKNEYQHALNPMIAFVNEFIDTSDSVKKHVWLVRAIIDLVLKDQSIQNDEVFFIDEGKAKSKNELIGIRTVCLPCFLLGVWHYVVTNRKDNSIGQETYNAWCPSAGGAKRIFDTSLGTGILADLSVVVTYTLCEENSQQIEPEIIETEAVDTTQQQAYQQTINHPFVFNFTQNGDNNTQIGYIEKYRADKNED